MDKFISADKVFNLLPVAMRHLSYSEEFNWVTGKFSGFGLDRGMEVYVARRTLSEYESKSAVATHYEESGFSLKKLFSPKFGAKLLYNKNLDIRKLGLIKVVYDGDGGNSAEAFFASPEAYPRSPDEWVPLFSEFPRTVLIIHHGDYQEIAFDDREAACDSDTPNASGVLYNSEKVLSIIKERNLIPLAVLGIDNDSGDDDDWYKCVNLVYCTEKNGLYDLKVIEEAMSRIPQINLQQPPADAIVKAHLSMLNWRDGEKSIDSVKNIEFIEWNTSMFMPTTRKRVEMENDPVALSDAFERIRAALGDPELETCGITGMTLLHGGDLSVHVQSRLGIADWECEIPGTTGGTDVYYVVAHRAKRSHLMAAFTHFRNFMDGDSFKKLIVRYIRKNALCPVLIQCVNGFDGSDESNFSVYAIHCKPLRETDNG